nr:AAA domain-containing protein [Candidatus Sigynarchaeota archaeon]
MSATDEERQPGDAPDNPIELAFVAFGNELDGCNFTQKKTNPDWPWFLDVLKQSGFEESSIHYFIRELFMEGKVLEGQQGAKHTFLMENIAHYDQDFNVVPLETRAKWVLRFPPGSKEADRTTVFYRTPTGKSERYQLCMVVKQKECRLLFTDMYFSPVQPQRVLERAVKVASLVSKGRYGGYAMTDTRIDLLKDPKFFPSYDQVLAGIVQDHMKYLGVLVNSIMAKDEHGVRVQKVERKGHLLIVSCMHDPKIIAEIRKMAGQDVSFVKVKKVKNGIPEQLPMTWDRDAMQKNGTRLDFEYVHVGKVKEFHETRDEGKVDVLVGIKDQDTFNIKDFAGHGMLITNVWLEIAPAIVQRYALMRLLYYAGANPNLPRFLVDSKAARCHVSAGDMTRDDLHDPRVWDDVNQRHALLGMLKARDLYLVLGPGGAGKTTLIAEAVYQFVKRGQTVLVLSQTNVAVDNVLHAIKFRPGVFPLRRGEPGRVTKEGRPFLEPVVYQNFTDTFYKNLETVLATTQNSAANEKFITVLHNVITNKGKRAPEQEKRVAQYYKRVINVIGCTCHVAGKDGAFADIGYGMRDVDVVIIDEVSKATFPEIVEGALRGKLVILVGDHYQLPPLFREIPHDEQDEKMKDLNDEFAKLFEESYFKKLFEAAPAEIKTALMTNYRMHSMIMRIVNLMYPAEFQLVSGINDADRPNAVLYYKNNHLLPRCRDHGMNVQWIDTSRFLLALSSELLPPGKPLESVKPGPGGWITNEAYQRPGSHSFINLYELKVTRHVLDQLVQKLVANPKQKQKIMLISLYADQTEELKTVVDDILGKYLTIDTAPEMEDLENKTFTKKDVEAFTIDDVVAGTVDAFQGKEAAIVILNLTTTDPSWFAKDRHRITVALSRARNTLIIVGSASEWSKAYIEVPTHIVQEKGGKQVDQIDRQRIFKEIIGFIEDNGGKLNANDVLGYTIK